MTGEARYTDDIPPPPGMLHGALVMSTRPYARLLKVDPAPALALPGVVRFVGHKDVPGGNKIGAVVKDEECFATEEVHHVGAVVGIVVAETEAAAQVRCSGRSVWVVGWLVGRCGWVLGVG